MNIYWKPRPKEEVMKISKKGIDLIKKYEGFRNHPYLCPADVPTIGYGTTVYPDGTKVTLDDPPITMLDAIQILYTMVERFEKGVNSLVKVELKQEQFDALVSFAYNVGLGAFGDSTLLKRVNNDPDDQDIKYQFSRWNKAGSQVLKGLKKRRNEESWLYFTHER